MSFLKPILAGILALAVVWVIPITSLSSEINFIYTIISIGLLLIVYAASLFLFGLSDEDRAILIRLQHRVGLILRKRKNNDQ
jgi:hypothetical protein